LWPFLNQILAIYQVPPVTKTIPVWLAKLAARGLETVYWLLRLSAEPPLTRFIVEQMSTSHWYDISAARRDFGYSPRVSIQQGLHLLGQGLPKDTRNA
jgi:nucleoside-diphosphate-sugar epimerase